MNVYVKETLCDLLISSKRITDAEDKLSSCVVIIPNAYFLVCMSAWISEVYKLDRVVLIPEQVILEYSRTSRYSKCPISRSEHSIKEI